MLRRNKRIHGREAIKHIIQDGGLVKLRFFVCRFLPNTLGFNRFAVAISKKLSKLATDRNHKRRQVYSALEELNRTRNAVPKDSYSDIVLLARSTAMNASFEELREDLHKFLQND